LREYIGSDYRLLCPELSEQKHHVGIDVDCPGMSILWGVQVDAPLWCVAQVPADRDGVLREIDIFPLQPASLSTTNARINQQPHISPPFKRFLLQPVNDSLNLRNRVRFHVLPLRFILPALGPFNLVHRIL